MENSPRVVEEDPEEDDDDAVEEEADRGSAVTVAYPWKEEISCVQKNSITLSPTENAFAIRS